jgi:hypothetical protein
MMDVYVQGKKVRLTQAEFKAQGGEGAVYIKGDIAYKVYADPAKMIPTAKIKELAVLTWPDIVRPQEILWDARKTPIGYSMRSVSDGLVLCQMFPKGFRERMGLTPDKALELVREFQRSVSHVHHSGLLIVDLNEMNFLVDPQFQHVYFIDVDSYQTPHFPATALMESVRDRHAQGWNPGTDWFSFAVVSFQMLVGIHPYKGKHPSLKTLEERMCANVSVLNPSVSVPAACLPFDVIPSAYREWYAAVLERGQRVPPPDDPFVTITLPAPPMRAEHAGGTFVVEPWPGRCLTDRVLTPQTHREIQATLEGHRVCLYDGHAQQEIPLDLMGERLMITEGRLYLKQGASLLEVDFVETPQRVWPRIRVVGSVLDQATQLFEGVSLQNLLGAWYASVLPSSGVCIQIRLPEMDGFQVIDAKFQGGVLMVVTSQAGRYRKWIFRFNAAYDGYDVRFCDDLQTLGINFVVLDHGVCLHLNDSEELELFPARMGAAGMKILSDPELGGDCQLLKDGSQALFSRDGHVYQFKLR